jgi:hypothetical protein
LVLTAGYLFGGNMRQRNARPFVTAAAAATLLITLSATLLLTLWVMGCGSDTDIKTSVSLDSGAHSATIEFHTGGASDIAVLFLTYPDGHRDMPLKGNVSKAGASLNAQDLAAGEYTYTVYWIPQGGQDPDSVAVETIVDSGQVVSGKFTVE